MLKSCQYSVFNGFKVSSYFSLKSKSPPSLLPSNVVYKLSCLCDTNVTNVGKTKQHLMVGCFNIWILKIQKSLKQGNRGDMRKIHVTWQFFEASGRYGDLIVKTKNPFLDKVNGSMCAKFQVCIVVSVARRRDTNKYINT